MNPHKFFREDMFRNDGTLKYSENVTLENNVSVHIVIHLWINVKEHIEKCFIFNKISKSICYDTVVSAWGDFENIVLHKINQLGLPQIIVNRLAWLTEFVGKQLFDWILFHASQLLSIGVQSTLTEYHILKTLINNLHLIKWANGGKIDNEQTAKTFISEEIYLDEEYKYGLACIYCLEEEIKKVSSTVLDKYFQMVLSTEINLNFVPMLCYWTCHLKGHDTFLLDLMQNTDMSINEYLLKKVYLIQRKQFVPAAKYFWNKLTNIQKSKLILDFIKNLEASTFKYLLISALDLEQQETIFKCDTFVRCFLQGLLQDWQWVDCFIPTIQHVSGNLSLFNYHFVLKEIYLNCYVDSADTFCKAAYYEKIFQYVVKNVPDHIRNS